jgi:hypothetical protein
MSGHLSQGMFLGGVDGASRYWLLTADQVWTIVQSPPHHQGNNRCRARHSRVEEWLHNWERLHRFDSAVVVRGLPVRACRRENDACSAESDSEHDKTDRQQNEDQQNGTKMPASVQGKPFQLA